MKKIIPSFLLAVLASSSLLVAQDKNRREATNQVIGCRLQALSREQATGNREQGRNSSEKALPLGENGQRVEPTADYELLTANNDNNQVKGDDSDITLSTITVRQYCDFLNAVAINNDAHHLYDAKGESHLGPIICHRISEAYHYSVITGKENESITGISILDGMRYCNWLENGQSIGEEGAETTEEGVYTLKGNKLIAINPHATNYLFNPGELLAENQVTLSFLSSFPVSTDLSRKLPDCWLCIASTTAPQLMMNPATGEEAGEKLVAGLKGLGVTAQREGATSFTSVKPEFLEKAMVGRNESDLKERYKKADELWSQKQKAREEKFKTHGKAEAAAEEVKKAQDVLEKETKEYSEKDIDKTWLARAARYADKAAIPLGFVPAPIPVAGIATAFSAMANFANQMWAKKDVNSAKQSLKCIAKEAKKAQEIAEKARLAFFAINKDTPIAEESAQNSDAKASIIAAKDLKSFADIKEVAHEAVLAWRERMTRSHQNIQTAEKQKNIIIQSLEKDRRQASIRDKNCEAKLNAAEEVYQAAVVEKTELEAKMESLDKELNTLEKQQAVRGRYKEEVADLIKNKEKEFFSIYHEGHPKACECLKAAEENKAIAIDHAYKANAELKLTREYRDAAEESHMGKIERAQAHFEADRVAGEKVFGIIIKPLEFETSRESEVMITQKTVEPPLISDEECREIGRGSKERGITGSEGKIKYAVEHYFEGDTSAWNELTSKERDAYNHGVLFANKAYNDNVTSRINDAVEKRRKANETLEQKNKSMTAAFGSSRKEAADAVAQAEAELAKVQTAEKERQEAIQRGKVVLKEQRNAIVLEFQKAEQIQQATEMKARQQEKDAINAKEKASDFFGLQGESPELTLTKSIQLWDEAIQKARESEAAWNQAAIYFQASYDQAPARLKNWWMTHLTSAKNSRAESAALVFWLEASKIESIAEAAKSGAEITETTTEEGIESLWNKALEKRSQTEAAWTQLVATQREAYAQAPEQFKASWLEGIEESENKKNFWVAQTSLYQAQKAESLAKAIQTKVCSNKKLSYQELVTLWDAAIDKLKESSQFLAQAAKEQQATCSLAPEQFKEIWSNSMRTVEDQQTRLAATKLTYQAQKASSIARAAKVLQKEALKKDNALESCFWDLVIGKSMQASECWETAQILLSTDQETAASWEKVAEQLVVSVEKCRKTAEALALSNIQQVRHLAQEANSASDISSSSLWELKSEEALKKANEEKENQNSAEFWKKIANQYQVILDYEQQAMKVFTAGKKDEGDLLDHASYYTGLSVETMIKASEAREAEKIGVAGGYEKAALILNQAAQAYAEGKEDQGRELGCAGEYVQSSAETMLKAIEAREAGETERSAEYEKVAAKSEQAAELRKQSAEVYGERKEDQGNQLGWAGLYTQSSAETMLKAIEAREAGKTILAAEYEKAAIKSDQAAGLMKQSAQAYAERKEDQGSELACAGEYTQESAKTMLKAIKARKVEQIELSAEYEKIAAKSEQAAELRRQSAQAYAAEEDQGRELGCAGEYTQANAETMLKAIEAREAGKTILAAEYEKAVIKSDQAAGLMKQSAQAYTAGEGDKGRRLNWVGACTQSSAKTMLKVIKAREAGNVNLVAAYERVITKLDQAVELKKKAIQSYTVEKENEGVALSEAGNYTQSSAETMLEAIEAREAGKTELSAEYEKVAVKSEQAAELKRQSAQAYAERKEEQGNELAYAGEYTQSSAKTMLKAIKAHEAGKTELSAEYEKAAAKSDQAAAFEVQSAQAYAERKENEGRRLNWVAACTQSSAKTMLKVIKAREAGNVNLVAAYERVVTKLDQAVELKKKAIQSYTGEKENEGVALSEAGNYTQSSAETMLKAIEAREAGKDELALSYDDAAIELDNAVKLRKSAIKAYEREGEELGDEIGKSY
ncbi:MAG TPA: hypothetical protein VJK54_03660, partial [Chthoniobacterales bacterium]|nr:hypothetical protein [Chthoniobacterales bacterium]